MKKTTQYGEIEIDTGHYIETAIYIPTWNGFKKSEYWDNSKYHMTTKGYHSQDLYDIFIMPDGILIATHTPN